MDIRNKQDLVEILMGAIDLPKGVAEKGVEAILEAVSSTLSGGHRVVLPNLGILEVSERAARAGRNPQTGAIMQIPASKSVRFKVAKRLKDALNS